MFQTATQSVILLADISDPTNDGILTTLVNFIIGGLMVVVAGLGAWYAFSAWRDAKGKKAALTELRDIAFGVVVIEAILGGIVALANYGSGALPFLN